MGLLLSYALTPPQGSLLSSRTPCCPRIDSRLNLDASRTSIKIRLQKRLLHELEHELLHQQPTGGAVTQLVLSIATANLNTRIRNRGFSARELWTQRDQFTNEQLPLTDYDLIRQQHSLRNANHAPSQLSKSPSHTVSKALNIDVGDIVYLYCDRNKSRSRCRYLVVRVDGVWLNVSKFIGNQLRATSYRVKRSECYKVAAHTLDPPTAYQYVDSTSTPTNDATPEPRSSIPTQLLYPATPDDAQSVHPIPDAQTPVVPDEERQQSEDEENFSAEELPQASGSPGQGRSRSPGLIAVGLCIRVVLH